MPARVALSFPAPPPGCALAPVRPALDRPRLPLTAAAMVAVLSFAAGLESDLTGPAPLPLATRNERN